MVSARRGGASAAFDRLNKYFALAEMPIVTSQYWNSVHGMQPEQVCQDIEGLQTMRTLGLDMAWMLKAIAQKKEAEGMPEERNHDSDQFYPLKQSAAFQQSGDRGKLIAVFPQRGNHGSKGVAE